MNNNELLEEALHLDADEKFILIDALLKSLDSSNNEIDSIWEDDVLQNIISSKEADK